MKNLDVIKNFINGEAKGKTKNLYIEGNNLINYYTIIATRNNGFKVNSTKYSQSTSTIQNALRRELTNMGIEYEEIDGKTMNA